MIRRSHASSYLEDIDAEFYRYVSGRLQETPCAQYEWRNDDTEVILRKRSAEGFDVIVGHCQDYLYISTDRGYHHHYEAYEDFSEILVTVMEVASELLTKNMRIREISANSKPRKWVLEHYRDGAWKKEAVVGLLVWNYFGKKSERYYSNDTLPVRQP